jgi:5-methyltetrahydropteroyltriglutamate--homocysteine methyltransferase
MNRLFLTQEIGSIQRPIWRQKLDSPANKGWINSALVWGERLGVDERDELANSKGTGLLQKDGLKRTVEEKSRIIDIATLYVIRMLETSGLDRVFNGEIPGTEMYDTVARRTNGIKTAGTLNSFDANYFKKGIIESELSITKEGIEFFDTSFEFVQKNTNRLVKPCWSGPYTMADWSYIEYHRQLREKKGERPKDALINSRRDAIIEFSQKVHNPIVKSLAKKGAKVIQIDEPAASTKEYESDVFTQAMNESFKGIPSSIEKAIHLCYSNYPALFPYLADCKADSYLIEFTNHASPTHFDPTQVSPEAYKIIELFKEYKMDVNVGVGVIDIHSDLIETPQVIRDRLLFAAKLIGDPSRVQVNPDCGLRTRQWHVAYPKLLNMCEGAALARAEFGD